MIQRSTLREQLADALRAEILAGRLAPGVVFTVREIAESYGVSATPVREALLDLTAQGLLESRQHRGFQVQAYTLTDFVRMVEARGLLGEGVLLRDPTLALPGWDPEAFSGIRRQAAAAVHAAHSGELDILIGYDLRFWSELTGLLGNTYIGSFLDRVRVQCWVFAVPRLRLARDLPNTLWHRHLELADAVERRDGAEAGRILRQFRDHALAYAVELEERFQAALPTPPPAGEDSPAPADGPDRG